MTDKEQIILDACCGSRMFHFDKNNKKVVFMDHRVFEDVLCDGRQLKIHPDIVADFRDMPFDDNTFSLVIFDPQQVTKIEYCQNAIYIFFNNSEMAGMWLKFPNEEIARQSIENFKMAVARKSIENEVTNE